MSIYVVPAWMKNLENEDLNFIKNFILSSGSLKEMAGQYHVSYPTVRNRLDMLIQKIGVDEPDEDPYVMLIKSMAINEKIDLESAKLLINEYRKMKKEI